jgi:flavin reductase (DIM6/NTAB) family NADH-FMN oxidoreductase RutF
MSTPVKPGEDRLRALETREGALSGCPILADSHAHMECEVMGKMDAGDHWVIYSTALGGKVEDEAQQTAIIHRKVGNHY